MKNRIPAVATLVGRTSIVIGVLVSCLLGVRLYHDDSADIYKKFTYEVDARAAAIDEQVGEHLAILYSLRALFDASGIVTRDEFRTFTSFLLARYPSIQALEWVPRVSARERLEVEARAQSEGLGRFQITERMEQGTMVSAKPRDEYYPVYFVEPLEGNRSALAFDIASNPTRREALYASRDTGEPRSTGRITLVQETANQWGVLIFVPVYQGAPTSTEERRESMRGVVLEVFRFHDLLVAAGADGPANGMIHMLVLDQVSKEETQVLHDAPLVGADLAPTYRYEKCLQPAGGRQWTLIATPSAAYISLHRSSTPYVSFLVGLLVTGLMAFSLDRLAREKHRVEQQVDERTRELRAESAALVESNASLQWEVAERRELQKRLTDVTDHEQRRLGQELHDSLGQQIAIMSLLAQSLQQKFDDENESVPKHVERLARSAELAQAQVRALSKGLLPMEIDSWGLQGALEQLVASTTNVSDVNVEFHCEEGVVVDGNVAATHLYRIAQEALRNALEHGEVSHVMITLSRDKQALTLAIRDDGKGFSATASTSSGAGLSSMHHRADLIGATLEIDSSEGHGTSVTCCLRDAADVG